MIWPFIRRSRHEESLSNVQSDLILARQNVDYYRRLASQRQTRIDTLEFELKKMNEDPTRRFVDGKEVMAEAGSSVTLLLKESSRVIEE